MEDRRTARLRLRRPTAADVPWLTALHSDPRNYDHSPFGAHSPAAARRLSEQALADWERDGVGYWLIEHADRPVGMVGIKPFSFAGGPAFNLYYRFVAEGRGRGFAGEACREARAVAAELDPARPIVVRTRPQNAAARALAESIGLRRAPELDSTDGFVVYLSGP